MYMRDALERFSALQRAENSSMQDGAGVGLGVRVFQCSSASRKFLNSDTHRATPVCNRGFSALQRAENSSIERFIRHSSRLPVFQCSSASRKFLNSYQVDDC